MAELPNDAPTVPAGPHPALRWTFTCLFGLNGLLGIYLFLPLWQGKVAPNRVTGFRTRQTMADPQLWFSVNTAVGRTLVLVDLALLIAAVILHFTVSRKRPLVSLGILMAVFLLGTIGATLQGYAMLPG